MRKILIGFLFLSLSYSAYAQVNLAKIGLLKRFVNEENWDGAVAVGSNLLIQNNTDIEAMYYTAIAHMNADRPNYAEALSLLQRMEGNPKLSKYKEYFFWLGRAQLGTSNAKAALESFQAYQNALGGKKVNNRI